MMKKGYFGQFGGSFVPSNLQRALDEVEVAFEEAMKDPAFNEELLELRKQYIGRENPLTYARRLSEEAGGAKIYLKREDLNHTGAHKINNAIGQALLARRMGKKRVVAETGAGQHGVATATACALFGIECRVYMGAVDVERQALNVFRMQALGAEVFAVEEGARTLKEAVDAALADYAQNAETTFYLLGSAVGPHPYPTIVRTFQQVIGEEARRQIVEAEGRLPDALVACVGGGSNAIGLFHPFVDDTAVQMIGVEPGGIGDAVGEHAVTLGKGSPGIIHGFKCYTLQDVEGNPSPVHSVAAGLDYPGVGPEHSHYHATGRAEYVAINDREALEAFLTLSKLEGIIPALESAHAVAQAIKTAGTMTKDQIIIVNLSGRGDKDVQTVRALVEEGAKKEPSQGKVQAS